MVDLAQMCKINYYSDRHFLIKAGYARKVLSKLFWVNDSSHFQRKEVGIKLGNEFKEASSTSKAQLLIVNVTIV